MELSIRAVHHLIKSQGDKRVSQPASESLRETLERFAGDIAEEAVVVAREDGYQTVKGRHVRQALNS